MSLGGVNVCEMYNEASVSLGAGKCMCKCLFW